MKLPRKARALSGMNPVGQTNIRKERLESIGRTIESRSLHIFTPEEVEAFGLARGFKVASESVRRRAYQAAVEQR